MKLETHQHSAGKPSCPLCRNSDTVRLFSSEDRVHFLPGTFEIFRCTSCRAAFIDPWLSDEELAAYYPENYGRYRHSRSLETKTDTRIRRFVLEHYYGYPLMNAEGRSSLKKAFAFCLSFVTAKGVIPYRGEGKILDVGCGGGSYLYRLKQRGWSVYGVEPSEAGAKQAQSLGLDVRHGLLAEARFPDQFFDVVRLNQVLEHLADPIGTFREIQRILKPDGFMYVSVPNTRSLVFWLFGKNWYPIDSPRHNLHYCPKTLEYLCDVTGFRIVHMSFEAGPFNFVRSVKYFFDGEGKGWPRGLRNIDWQRSKFIRRSLKPIFALIDGLGYGDFLHATLQKIEK